MQRDPCYDYLDLWWQFFEEVVETFDVFGAEGFSSQTFNSRKAVSVDDKFLVSFCQD